MIRAMELRNLSSHTQRTYLRAVTEIAKFYNQSPDKITKENVEDYLLYLKHDKALRPTAATAFLPDFAFFIKTSSKMRYPSHTASRDPRENFPKSLPWKM